MPETPISQPPLCGAPLGLAPCQQAQFRDLGPEDYDVIHDGRHIGRIFHASAGVPPDQPRMWTIG